MINDTIFLVSCNNNCNLAKNNYLVQELYKTWIYFSDNVNGQVQSTAGDI